MTAWLIIICVANVPCIVDPEHYTRVQCYRYAALYRHAGAKASCKRKEVVIPEE